MGDGGDDENNLDEESNDEDWFFNVYLRSYNSKINLCYEKEIETHICSYCILSILKL